MNLLEELLNFYKQETINRSLLLVLKKLQGDINLRNLFEMKVKY